MATKRNNGLNLICGKPRAIEGRKEKLFPVTVKRGGKGLELGDFLAKSESDAKKQARTVIRRELGK